MTKKLIKFTIIFTSILTALLVVQPKIAQVSADTGDLLMFDQIAPNEEIFRGDVILFGGTIYNNDSLRTFVLLFLYIDLLDPNNESAWLDPAPFGPFSFEGLAFRNTLEPYDSRAFLFEDTIDKEVPIGENFTMRMQIEFIRDENLGDDQVRPYLKTFGDNVTDLNISVRRVDAPNYIYIVFVLLLLGITAFIIIGLVGWIRERRNK
ncbi:MAG: hypothetical protein FK730_12440 [Asgard group archaeon]|nr:hypothetical protein [Asgard group archaeon]